MTLPLTFNLASQIDLLELGLQNSEYSKHNYVVHPNTQGMGGVGVWNYTDMCEFLHKCKQILANHSEDICKFALACLSLF